MPAPTMPAPAITVFVPTHNHAYSLGRVFESLNAQTCQDFEWLIIDSASSDNTETLVQSWQQRSSYDIRYQYIPSAGKHTAINLAVRLARGQFLVMLDSSDWLAVNALERMLEVWHTIPNPDRFSGVVGLCADPDGRIVGDRFPSDPLDANAVELSHSLRVRGEKVSLARTEALREFPFPFPESHGLVAESIVWNRMAKRYQERYVNEVFVKRDYKIDGLTKRPLEMQIRMPLAARLYHLELAHAPQRIASKERLKALVNYMRFSLHAGMDLASTLREARSVLAIALLPVAMLLYFRDRRRFGPLAMLTQLTMYCGLALRSFEEQLETLACLI